jgi:hypothetical protein
MLMELSIRAKHTMLMELSIRAKHTLLMELSICDPICMQTLQAAVAEKARLEAALAAAQDGQELARQELEQRRAAGINMQAALQQLQTAMQTVVNASGQLTR